MAVSVALFSDPGCPWGYSADRCEAALRWRYGDQLDWELVMIGLAEDGSQYTDRGYTPEMMAGFLPKFSAAFGMPFRYEPKDHVAATSPACRAIVAAGLQGGTAAAFEAFRALQFMQFTTAGALDSTDDIQAALEGLEEIDAAAVVGAGEDDRRRRVANGPVGVGRLAQRLGRASGSLPGPLAAGLVGLHDLG